MRKIATVACGLACAAAMAGCGRDIRMTLKPQANSARIRIDTDDEALGFMLLWVPEAIVTDRGFSGLYPKGSWAGDEKQLRQSVGREKALRAGNFTRVDKDTLEYDGIRTAVDSPVKWATTVRAEPGGVRFSIRLTNLGDSVMRKAGAAVCLKFRPRGWWSAETTYVLSGGKLTPLADLGTDAGRANNFQAYLLAGESYGNAFYREFWGFNEHRVDRPVIVSENSAAGACIVIESQRAYFVHCNRGNPCTDMMLAFGDVAPGETATAEGRIRVVRGDAEDAIRRR